ncbi:MAG: helix-turn-helix domain-containing protein [Erysipelotrichaceae bacterium]
MHKTNKALVIEEAANDLFIENGINNTSVNDIAKKANIAKGTFYLYYKDKDTLVKECVLKKGISIFNDIAAKSYIESKESECAWSICLTKSAMNYFIVNPTTLAFLFQNHFQCIVSIKDLTPTLLNFVDYLKNNHCSVECAFNKLIIILDMITSTTYGVLEHQNPHSIDEVNNLLVHLIEHITEFMED